MGGRAAIESPHGWGVVQISTIVHRGKGVKNALTSVHVVYLWSLPITKESGAKKLQNKNNLLLYFFKSIIFAQSIENWSK